MVADSDRHATHAIPPSCGFPLPANRLSLPAPLTTSRHQLAGCPSAQCPLHGCTGTELTSYPWLYILSRRRLPLSSSKSELHCSIVPAGRTKFRETRHPVFRGVRRRGAAGRWVCEVRVPGKRGARLWLGTYLAAESAARAQDAAMLALGRGGAGCLNFPDSAWLLAVPPPSAISGLEEARRAVLEAVADFQRRFGGASGGCEAVDEATSGVSAPPSSSSLLPGISSGSPAPALDKQVAVKAGETAAALHGDVFETDWFGDMGMDLDVYYASLAEGLLVEPPPPAAAWDHGDCCDAGADVALWSY